MHQAFDTSIREHGYTGEYCCVYPIKVNQQRQVVEEVFEFGRAYKFGLEAGSKPELLAVLAIADNETPIICNGFKDDEYIEMVMLAKKIGRRIIPVVEKYTELELIAKHAREVGVKPVIGLRVKLASRGSGRWKSSGGYRSKFGLTVTEALKAVEYLKGLGLEDSLELLHFHLGSQITNIRQIKAAVVEAARIYVDLKKMGTGLTYLDVGGGLGIDYDGSQTDFESSVNYTLEEYARDVVYHIQSICDEAEVPHPTIITESGRAVAAYHSLLVFNVLGVSGFGEEELPTSLPEDAEQSLIDLFETHRSLSKKNLLESHHDAQQALDSALNLFSLGYLSLSQRSLSENLYWAICRKTLHLAGELEYFPEELEGLNGLLSDTYFCNFSLFQSMPDSWAVKQLFPIMPIHRLEERPTRLGVLGDISCDSDGKVDQFIDRHDVKKTLPLHPSIRQLHPRSLSAGRVSGNSRRSAQSFRRYQRGACQPRSARRHCARNRSQRRHGSRSSRLRPVQLADFARSVPQRCGARGPRAAYRLRGIGPPAKVLRGRAARLHLSRAVASPLRFA